MKMKSLLRSILVILISVTSIKTDACRYTIREIGFSDIGSRPYLIHIYTDSDFPVEQITTIRELSLVLLKETNISLEIINVDEGMDSLAQYHLEKHDIGTIPSAVFFSPEGESLPLSMEFPGRSFQESIYLLFETLATSDIRESVIDQLLQSYCVVLVIEGSDPSLNSHAVRATNDAVSEISLVLDQMPKEVNALPAVMVVPHQKILDERILSMGLGIEPEEAREPHIAIIYGRGRILGSVLRGEEINKHSLYNLLAVVGADCECGLDQSWILGKMIPLRWESSAQTELAWSLGFDVENPMVKSEMSQILSVKPPSDPFMDPLGGNLLVYTEGELKIEKDPGKKNRISAYQIRNSFHRQDNPVIRILIFGLGGILLVVFAALVILLIRRGRNPS